MSRFYKLFPILLLLVVSADAAEPLIVAHRGLLLHAPENTLANFRACLELRLGFEFDVQRTKDGHLVCIHDNTVDRTTDGTGKVSEMTLAEARGLDAGGWFDPKFAGERVPTVEEVLKLVAGYRRHDVLIAVDLKAVVRLAERHGVLDRLLFIGRAISEPQVRERIKGVEAAAVANDPDEFPQALVAPHADWVYFCYLPPKEQVEAVRGAGKRAFIAGETVSGNRPENSGCRSGHGRYIDGLSAGTARHGGTMSDRSKQVECPVHGRSFATFVCRHLAGGTAAGFYHADDRGDSHPDAWCGECEEARPRESEPPYFGWLSTSLPLYPETLNLKARVHTRPLGQRPSVELEPTEHPLAVEQRNGVTMARVRAIAEALLHPENHADL